VKKFEVKIVKKINNLEIINIELNSNDSIRLDNYKVLIENNNYNINSQQLYNSIKNYINENMNSLVDKSRTDSNENTDGSLINISINSGRLKLNVEVYSNDNDDFYNNYINEIVSAIKENGDKTNSDYIMDFVEKGKDLPLTLDDEEFAKYSKLFEEKFGRKAYIAEPSGTKEQTIVAIKTCLEKNEDILDELLYPNKNDDVFY